MREFTIPQRVFAQLAARRQAWPIPYTEEELLATWRGPHRLLLYVHIADPDDKWTVGMKLNGQPVEVKKAYGDVFPLGRERTFTGFYADVSHLKPDTRYAVEVDAARRPPARPVPGPVLRERRGGVHDRAGDPGKLTCRRGKGSWPPPTARWWGQPWQLPAPCWRAEVQAHGQRRNVLRLRAAVRNRCVRVEAQETDHVVRDRMRLWFARQRGRQHGVAHRGVLGVTWTWSSSA